MDHAIIKPLYEIISIVVNQIMINKTIYKIKINGYILKANLTSPKKSKSSDEKKFIDVFIFLFLHLSQTLGTQV